MAASTQKLQNGGVFFALTGGGGIKIQVGKYVQLTILLGSNFGMYDKNILLINYK